MTIHHIINDYNLSQGGAQKLVLELHKSLIDKGHNSKLFGLSKNPKYNIKDVYSLQNKSPYSLHSFYGLWQYFRKEVNRKDIVHVHLFPTSFMVSVLRILKLIPSCALLLTEHSTENRRRNLFFGKIIDRILYRSYSHIIAISQGVANSLISYKPDCRDKIKIITNGIELFFTKPIYRQAKNKNIIISVGRLHKSKNYHLALRAIKKITDMDFEYWIVGSGDLYDELNQYSQSLNLKNKVKFMGYVADVSDLLKKADIFLIPSKWEGFGLAAIEAMNASLPCLISNVSGLREVVSKDGHDAFLIEPFNEKLIADKLSILLKSHRLRIDLGTKAFVNSLNFDKNKMTFEHIKLYQKIISYEF